MGKKYHDFDLLITQCSDNYIARVVNSPAGEAKHIFSLPFSFDQIQNYLQHFNQTRTILVHSNRQEQKNLEQDRYFVGKTLYDSIFTGDVEDVLQRSLAKTTANNEGLRLNLRLTEVPELINLPWEYLYDESEDYFFSLSINTPIMRYLALETSVKPAVQELPLQVLIVISNPDDYPDLDVEKECNNIHHALCDLEQKGYVQVTLLSNTTLADLQNTLSERDFHIFHFIGHGGFNQEDETGVLIFENQQGEGHAVSGKTLAMLLHDVQSLRLAILNACEGARTSLCNAFGGVGQCLMRQGMPAVIAMQNEITDMTAVIFAHKLYTSLVKGYDIDVALVETRKAISAQSNGVEWGTPVLYMRPGGHTIVDNNLIERRKQQQTMNYISALQPILNPYTATPNLSPYTFKPIKVVSLSLIN